MSKYGLYFVPWSVPSSHRLLLFLNSYYIESSPLLCLRESQSRDRNPISTQAGLDVYVTTSMIEVIIKRNAIRYTQHFYRTALKRDDGTGSTISGTGIIL